MINAQDIACLNASDGGIAPDARRGFPRPRWDNLECIAMACTFELSHTPYLNGPCPVPHSLHLRRFGFGPLSASAVWVMTTLPYEPQDDPRVGNIPVSRRAQLDVDTLGHWGDLCAIASETW